jgi:catechol 2,3-dioxygenase-like lactoylglutathione lyase family enzyme
MLRKIDCVMIRVPDLDAAARYYTEVLGLHEVWREGPWVGLGFPETDAEIVLHTDPDIPEQSLVHYLVDDVEAAVATLRAWGCRVVEEPFDIRIGKCAVITDPFGVALCILDATKMASAEA